MRKLIILNTSQFGLLTDSYKWCQYLKQYVDITFICFDNKHKRMDIPGVNYKYVYRFDNSLLRGVWYILYSLFYCLFNQSKVFIVYFDFCHIFPLLLGKDRFHVDVRTLAVTDDDDLNKRQDLKLRNSLSYFKSVSYISEGIKDKISLDIQNQYILPLGADVISTKEKEWDKLKLLYVGTMNHRDIPKTIDGLYMFTQKYGKHNISYDIVGDGSELEQVKQKVREYNLSDIVSVHGKVMYDELSTFFNENNIGISFVPQKECYQHQPPTKSYEYILSGLYCIATNTVSNREIINFNNGILIEDTASSFCDALSYVAENLHQISKLEINNTLIDSHTWSSIVEKSLRPIVDMLTGTDPI